MAKTPKKKTPAKKTAAAKAVPVKKRVTAAAKPSTAITKTSQIAASEGGRGGSGSAKALANLIAMRKKSKPAAGAASKPIAEPTSTLKAKVGAKAKVAAKPAVKPAAKKAPVKKKVTVSAKEAVVKKKVTVSAKKAVVKKKTTVPAKKAPLKRKPTVPAKKVVKKKVAAPAKPQKTLKEKMAGLKVKPVKTVTAANAKRVLAVHPDVEVLRVIRESLAEDGIAVESSPTPERAFELSLQRTYALFIFGIDMPRVPGEALYDMISLTYQNIAKPRTAPGMVYISESVSADHAEELRREARVKGILTGEVTEKRVRDLVKTAIPTRRR